MKDGKHTDESGREEWYQNGKLHRTDGPAVCDEFGNQWWVQDGKFHRTDGPAIIYISGTQRWYINGKEMTESEFLIIKEGLEFDKMMREMLTEPEAGWMV